MDEHIYICLFELQASSLMNSGFLTWEVEELDTKLGATCSIPGHLSYRSTGAQVEFGTDMEFMEKLTHNNTTVFDTEEK